MDTGTYILVLIVFFTLFKESCSITLADTQITLTMHNYTATWDLALATCIHNEGTLYTEDSQERNYVLENFTAAWPREHLWLGLHYPTTVSNVEYGWTDCYAQDLNIFNNWNAGYADSPSEKRCAFSGKVFHHWKARNCTVKFRFVCQNQGGPCTFTSATGSPKSSSKFEAVTMTVQNETVCLHVCMTQIHNYTNCWAVNFEAQTCILYYTEDPFLFETHPLKSSTAAFHAKQCYFNNGVVSTKDNSINATEGPSPNSGCVTFNSKTTPTTFVPTSTTIIPTTSTVSTTIIQTTGTAAPTTISTISTAALTTMPTTSTAVQTTTIPTSTAAPTTTIPTSTAAPTTTIPTSTAAPTTTIPTSTAAPTTISTTNTAAPTTISTTSTAAPTTISTTSTAAPTTTIPTSTAAPTTTIPTSTAAPTTISATSTAAPTTIPTSTAAPTTISTTSTAAPTTTIPTTSTAAPTTIPTSTAAPTTISTTSTAAPTTTIPTTSTPVPTTISTTSTVAPTTTILTTSTASSTTISTTSTAASTTIPTTSTPVPTTISTTSTVAPSTASCNCCCTRIVSELSNLTLSEKVATIQARLKVNVETLSSSIRKKTSATDERASSQSIGYGALITICIEIFMVTITDLVNVVSFFLAKIQNSLAKP